MRFDELIEGSFRVIAQYPVEMECVRSERSPSGVGGGVVHPGAKVMG